MPEHYYFVRVGELNTNNLTLYIFFSYSVATLTVIQLLRTDLFLLLKPSLYASILNPGVVTFQ